MTKHNVCIHTDDKKYTQISKIDKSFSSVNIGEHKLKVNVNALNQRVWDTSDTIYWQLDSEYEFMTEKEQANMIKAAFLESSLLTDLKIRQKRRQSGDAHIRINWLGAKDEKFFKDMGSVLAYAYGPHQGIGGDITMNSDKIWRLDRSPLTAEKAKELGFINGFDDPTNTLRTYDPLHTMKHEGGHAIGMNHIENAEHQRTAILYPYYNGLRRFGQVDIDYLFTLYNKSNIWKRASDFMEFYLKRF